MNAVELLYRIEKGEMLSNSELDEDLRKLATAVNSLVTAFNTNYASPTATRVGEIVAWGGTSLPVNSVWLNGLTLSQTTYSALYAIFGTTYNTGGEAVGTFRLPKMMGKILIGNNPMGGQTDATFSTFALGHYYGSKTSAVVFPTFSAGAFPILTGGVLPSSVGGTLPVYTAGTAATWYEGTASSSTGGSAPTLTIDVTGTISTNGHTHSIGQTSIKQGAESSIDVDTAGTTGSSTDTINKSAIGGLFTFSAGAYPTFSAGVLPNWTAGAAPSFSAGSYPIFDAGSFQTLTAGTAPSSTGGTSSFSIIPPTMGCNFITYFQ